MSTDKHDEIQRYINKRMEKIGSKSRDNKREKLLDRDAAVLSSERKRILFRFDSDVLKWVSGTDDERE